MIGMGIGMAAGLAVALVSTPTSASDKSPSTMRHHVPQMLIPMGGGAVGALVGGRFAREKVIYSPRLQAPTDPRERQRE